MISIKMNIKYFNLLSSFNYNTYRNNTYKNNKYTNNT